MRYLSVLFFFFLFTFSAQANKTAAEIYIDLQKLSSLKRVLYIAAHPDDENTRALAWFSLGEKAETAYLSLTRGDGGQNLIGDELSEYLGVLRTQELLAARSYDGAKQFFTRAVDFGYSKSAEETLEKWGKDEILSDVVLVIRKFKPDVIITRFPPDGRGGHGHHSASAMLAIEGFEKAADPEYQPEQVAQYGTWKTNSIYWNTSYWWNREIADSAENNPDFLVKDIGGYNSLLGMSYNEIGTIARSQHKCQGFGAIIERGSLTEYFQYLGGKKIASNFFEDSERTWESLGSKSLNKKFQQLMQEFDFDQTENNVYPLFEIRDELKRLETNPLIDEKIKLCESIIVNCLGLHIEALTDDFAYVKGREMKVMLHAINRSSIDLHINEIQIANKKEVVQKTVIENKKFEWEITHQVKEDFSTPYWLVHPFDNLFDVREFSHLGNAENPPTFSLQINMTIAGNELERLIPVTYKWRDPSYGEKRRPVLSTPSFTANVEQEISLFKQKESKIIRVNIHSFVDSLKDEIHIQYPEGWKVEPEVIPVQFGAKHEEKWVSFEIKPSRKSEDGEVTFKNKAGETLYNYREIAYDHIPTQAIIRPSKMKVLQLDAEIEEGRVAYIKGVKDAVPVGIEQLGFTVDVFEVADLSTLDLSTYSSVVLGIRIYNVYPEMLNFNNKLFHYVEEGGNVVMQYNTASRSQSDQTFGPLPFELSRNRVTEEDATVTFLAPDHPILNAPNKITAADFEGWVQERGLYFADNWDSAYLPLFSWHDKGEEPQKGALIVAKYGKGQFVYTGISFFRELPNGVVGAYRLLANILSYPND
ncbi:MAG: PIG-L family deacetylase [Crocinitomicaceae bacterium]